MVITAGEAADQLNLDAFIAQAASAVGYDDVFVRDGSPSRAASSDTNAVPDRDTNPR